MSQFDMNKDKNKVMKDQLISDVASNVNKQPFAMMKSRLGFYSEDRAQTDRPPPVGSYNPRYDIILPRIPGTRIKKKLKRKKKPILVNSESMPMGLGRNESSVISLPNMPNTTRGKKSIMMGNNSQLKQ